MALGAY
ncbi:hypothetical protein D031_3059A, partial [Vibrio parahaemolyticus VP-48]